MWTAAFLALLSAAALSLSPPPARAQVFITNSEHMIGVERAAGANIGLGGTQNRLVLAQPFTIPAGDSVNIRQVAVYLGNVPGGRVTTAGRRIEVAIFNARANPICDTEDANYNEFNCNNLAYLPAATGDDPHLLYDPDDANRLTNYLFQFTNPTSLENGRNVFTAPASASALAPGTYALYMGMDTNDGHAITTNHFEMKVGQCSSRERNPDANDPGRYLDEVDNGNAWTLHQTASTTFGGRAFEVGPASGFGGEFFGQHTGRTILIDIIGEPNHAPTARITGDVAVDELQTFEDLDDDNGLPTGPADITLQWTRAELDGSGKVDIGGETDTMYTLTNDDREMQFGVDVDDYVDQHCYPNDDVSFTKDFPNQDATGQPTIEGTPHLGETLRSDITGIDDDDGKTRAESVLPADAEFAFTYQWQAETGEGETPWEDIPGATESMYEIEDGTYLGMALRVVVTFVDDIGHDEALVSPPTAVVSEAPNNATGAPTVRGDYEVGETLTAITSAISDPDGPDPIPDASFSYQWESAADDTGTDAMDIGEDSATYLLTAAEGGRLVRVTVTFDDDDGNEESLSSDWTDEVQASATGLEVDGDYEVGETLTANTDGIADPNGLGTPAYTYEWERASASDGAGARSVGTSASYELVMADGGNYVRVTVRFNDAEGNPEAPSSAWTPVQASSMGLEVDGDYEVGRTLTANTDGIEDPNGLGTPTYTYEWERATASDGTGAQSVGTSASYELVMADGGNYVRVTVRFNDAEGNPEAPSSAWTPVQASATGLAITGEVKVRGTLTADTDAIDDPNGKPSDPNDYTYQWHRLDPGSGPRPLGTGATYEVVPEDHQDGDSQIRLTVIFVDGAGQREELSATTGDVAPYEPNDEATGELEIVDPESGEPTVVGTLEVGHTLMADVSGIHDPNGLPDPSTYRYRWERLGADGTGMPVTLSEGVGQSTYTLQRGDAGGTIQVQVSFRDRAGHLENVVSDPTGQVLASAAAGHEARIREWMALFGRTVSEQVLDAVGGRLHSASQAQQGEMKLAGRQVRWTPGHEDDAFARNTVEAWFGSQDPRDWLGVRALGDEEALLRSSFSLTHGTAHGGYASVWGRGGYTFFSSRESEIELEGDVRMGQFGADWAFGPWMAGLSIGHSAGEGEYWDDNGEGEIETTLTGVYPYARYDLSERASAWAVTGYGEGDLKVVPESGSSEPAVETGVTLTMGAAGMRTEMVTAAEAGGGVSLALKADVSIMRMDSEETTALNAVQSHANRMRLGVEAAGSRAELEHGGTLAPVMDLGVLYDGGDAGKGRGMDAGVGIAYACPECGITAGFKGRSLIAHSGPGRREWGVSGSVRYDANPAASGGRGLSMSLGGGYGGRSSTGGMDAVFDLETVEDMGGRRDGDLPGGRMDAQVGYGLRAFEHRYTSTPKASLGLTESGAAWGLGWWLTPAKSGGAAPALRGGLELQGGEAKDQRIGLRLNANF